MSDRFRFFHGWCFCRIVPGSRWATLVFCANCPGVRRFHFAGQKAKRVAGFTLDSGAAVVNAVGFGWRKAIRQSHCRRKDSPEIVQDTSSSRATTRRVNTWSRMESGSSRFASVNSGHEQVGQKVTIDGKTALSNVDTPAGTFHEVAIEIEVLDQRATIALGSQGPGCNTCHNWVRFRSVP